MRPDYGLEFFAKGIRGKYYERYQQGTDIALLEPKVRAAFPTDTEVNEASRLLLRVARQTVANASVQETEPLYHNYGESENRVRFHQHQRTIN